MTKGHIERFFDRLQLFLRNPDTEEPPAEVEPVFEGDEFGIHIFYGTNDDEQWEIVEAWNECYPYYMTKWATPDCRTSVYGGETAKDDRYYIHLPLADIAKHLRVNYGETRLFAPIIPAITVGTYRLDSHKDKLMRKLMNDLEAPSVSQQQFHEYLRINSQLTRLCLNPNSQLRLTNIKPVYENGRCGLHILHPDPTILKLVMMRQKIFNSINHGGELKDCKENGKTSFIHLQLGKYSGYLINTCVFDAVMKRKSTW